MTANVLTIAFDAGTNLTVNLTDGTSLTGDFVSVNSKGVNLRVDGKVVSRSLSRVANVARTMPTCDGDPIEDDHDYTTAELAAIFDTSARSLRVQLRRIGVGVGQGHSYRFTATQARAVRAQLTA
jgi:hypothetical protein